MTPFEMVEIIVNKYNDIVKNENGLICNLDIIEIIIPRKMAYDFHYLDEFNYANAAEMIRRIFPNCKLEFNEVDEIMIKYNLVKTFCLKMIDCINDATHNVFATTYYEVVLAMKLKINGDNIQVWDYQKLKWSNSLETLEKLKEHLYIEPI